MTTNSKMVMVGLAACALAACQATAADLIVNGGFEQSKIPVGQGWQNVTPDSQGKSTLLPGWTIDDGNVDLVSSSYINPHTGKQSLDLNGDTQGTISQHFDGTKITKTGDYQFSFWYAGNFYDANQVPKKVMSEAGDKMSFEVAKPQGTDPSKVTWLPYTTTLHLQAGQDLLISFTSLAIKTEYNGPMLDDVALLTPIPEPYQYGLASMFGLFGLAAFDRIRQRRLCR